VDLQRQGNDGSPERMKDVDREAGFNFVFFSATVASKAFKYPRHGIIIPNPTLTPTSNSPFRFFRL
jgi:hypothetical protein